MSRIPSADSDLSSESIRSNSDRAIRLDLFGQRIANCPGSLAIVFMPGFMGETIGFGSRVASLLMENNFLPKDMLAVVSRYREQAAARSLGYEEVAGEIELAYKGTNLTTSSEAGPHTYSYADAFRAVDDAHQSFMSGTLGKSVGLVVVVNPIDAQHIAGFEVGEGQIDTMKGGALIPSVISSDGKYSGQPDIAWTPLS